MIIKLSCKQYKIFLILSVVSCLLIMVISSIELNSFNNNAEFKVKGTEIIDPKGQEFIAHGLLARAEYYRVTGDLDKAQKDVDEAFSIASRGGMGLHLAGCHLEYARLALARGEKEKAGTTLLGSLKVKQK